MGMSISIHKGAFITGIVMAVGVQAGGYPEDMNSTRNAGNTYGFTAGNHGQSTTKNTVISDTGRITTIIEEGLPSEKFVRFAGMMA